MLSVAMLCCPSFADGRYAESGVIGQLSMGSGREARHSLHPYFTITLGTECGIVLTPRTGAGEAKRRR